MYLFDVARRRFWFRIIRQISRRTNLNLIVEVVTKAADLFLWVIRAISATLIVSILKKGNQITIHNDLFWLSLWNIVWGEDDGNELNIRDHYSDWGEHPRWLLPNIRVVRNNRRTVSGGNWERTERENRRWEIMARRKIQLPQQRKRKTIERLDMGEVNKAGYTSVAFVMLSQSQSKAHLLWGGWYAMQ